MHREHREKRWDCWPGEAKKGSGKHWKRGREREAIMSLVGGCCITGARGSHVAMSGGLWREGPGLRRKVKFEIHDFKNQILSAALHNPPAKGRLHVAYCQFFVCFSGLYYKV